MFPGDIPESAASILAPTDGEADSLESLTKKQKKLKKLQERRLRQSKAVEGYADDIEEPQDASGSTLCATGDFNCNDDAGVQEPPDEEESAVGEWWMCDACGLGIRAGKKR